MQKLAFVKDPEIYNEEYLPPSLLSLFYEFSLLKGFCDILILSSVGLGCLKIWFESQFLGLEDQ